MAIPKRWKAKLLPCIASLIFWKASLIPWKASLIFWIAYLIV